MDLFKTAQISTVFDESFSLLLLCPNCKQQIPHLSLLHNTKNNSIEVKIKCLCSQLINLELFDYLQIIKDKPKQNYHCNMNEDHFDRRAVIYCSFCHSWLCQECFNIHNKSNNDHIALKQEIRLTCIEHKPKKLKWYCNDCKKSICKKCHLATHIKHDIHTIEGYNNIEKLLNESAKIGEIMQLNKDLKNSFVKTFTTSINQLTHWMSDIETVYRHNESNNQLLRDFIQIIINTWSMTKEVPNYELKQTMSEIKLNTEPNVIKWNTLDQYHSKLKQMLKTQYALKLQMYSNANIVITDKKSKEHKNIIANEKELEQWELVLFNQESFRKDKPISLIISHTEFEIQQKLIKVNANPQLETQNIIDDIQENIVISQPVTLSKINTTYMKKEPKNNINNAKTAIGANDTLIKKSKVKHQSVDMPTQQKRLGTNNKVNKNN